MDGGNVISENRDVLESVRPRSDSIRNEHVLSNETESMNELRLGI